jgi:hypothetical protein
MVWRNKHFGDRSATLQANISIFTTKGNKLLSGKAPARSKQPSFTPMVFDCSIFWMSSLVSLVLGFYFVWIVFDPIQVPI